ncbi:MAG: AtpZ/AtpI family protein, partial [Acidimicrobiales bacterium]
QDKSSPRVIDLLSMGLASALSVGGGVGLGFLVDNWLGSSPLLTFLGLALGVVLAVAVTVREARKYL